LATTETATTRTHVPTDVVRNSVLLALAQCIGWLAIQTHVVLAGPIAADLAGDTRWAGTPLTLMGVAAALTAPTAGRLMDRFGRRPPLIAGQIFIGIGCAAAGLSVLGSTLWGFLAGMVLLGMGTGATALSRSAAADMYPPSLRAQGLSFVVMGGAVGAIGGPFLLAAFMGWVERAGADSMAAPWLALPLLSLAGIAALVAVRPDPRQIAADLASYYPGEVIQRDGEIAPPRPLFAILKQYPVVVAIAATGLVQAGMVMFMATAPLDMRLHGHGDALSGVISGHFFGMFGLSIFAGRLADKLGRRAVILGGGLIFIAGALATSNFQSPLYSGAGLFLVGLGWSLCFVSANTVLADLTRPLERGRTLGANDLLVGLAGSAASLLGGVLLGGLGYFWVGIIAVAFACVPLALALAMREREPGRYEASA
jgi:MFS family permease